MGIDLVSVSEVEESLARHGRRYLTRVFTDAERRDSGTDPRSLALRFAAKEATMKALGRTDEAIGWQSIAVTVDAHGVPAIQLTGGASDLAQQRGVRSVAVSLSQERDHAAAVVLMEARP